MLHKYSYFGHMDLVWLQLPPWRHQKYSPASSTLIVHSNVSGDTLCLLIALVMFHRIAISRCSRLLSKFDVINPEFSAKHWQRHARPRVRPSGSCAHTTC